LRYRLFPDSSAFLSLDEVQLCHLLRPFAQGCRTSGRPKICAVPAALPASDNDVQKGYFYFGGSIREIFAPPEQQVQRRATITDTLTRLNTQHKDVLLQLAEVNISVFQQPALASQEISRLWSLLPDPTYKSATQEAASFVLQEALKVIIRDTVQVYRLSSDASIFLLPTMRASPWRFAHLSTKQRESRRSPNLSKKTSLDRRNPRNLGKTSRNRRLN